MKIEEGIEEFLKELEARGRSPFTLRHYRGHLRLFTRWLKRRESAVRSDAEPSLSLDLRKIQVTIRFSKSNSPYFKEAVRLAKELPGYRCVDSKLHEIKVPAALEELDLWQRVKQLADGVGHWKRSEVVVEGGAVSHTERDFCARTSATSWWGISGPRPFLQRKRRQRL